MAESLGSAVLTVSVDDRQFQAGLNAARSKADQAAGQITQSFGGITNSLRQLAGVAGIVGIGALTQQLIATGQESQRAQIQLNSLAGAYGEAAGAGEAAARIQKVLGISAVDATQGFAQLYAALRGTGIGLKQLEVLFVGISNAARLSGAGTQEAQAALLQLKQGLAAGVLQGDELRSVLEQLPAFAQAIAGQLNVNVGQLRKLGSEGKITSDIVFNAAKQLASATVPGRTEIEQIGVAFENVKAQAAAALGPPLLGVLQATAAGLIAFKRFLEENQQALVGVGQRVVEIGRTLAPFVAGILAVQAAMKAWSIASKAVATAQAAVLALQGPKGWAILAGAIAASAGAAVVLEKTLQSVGTATKDAKVEAQAAFDQFQELLNNTSLSKAGGGIGAGIKEAAKSLLSAAQSFVDAAKALQSTSEGNFKFLTKAAQQQTLSNARLDIQKGVNTGYIDPKFLNARKPDDVFAAANASRSQVDALQSFNQAAADYTNAINQSNQTLGSVSTQLPEVANKIIALQGSLEGLAQKDWSVNVSVTGDSAANVRVD